MERCSLVEKLFCADSVAPPMLVRELDYVGAYRDGRLRIDDQVEGADVVPHVDEGEGTALGTLGLRVDVRPQVFERRLVEGVIAADFGDRHRRGGGAESPAHPEEVSRGGGAFDVRRDKLVVVTLQLNVCQGSRKEGAGRKTSGEGSGEDEEEKDAKESRGGAGNGAHGEEVGSGKGMGEESATAAVGSIAAGTPEEHTSS